MIADDVLAARLTAQHLAGTPAASPLDAVRTLVAVDARDAALARASLALRAGCTAGAVREAVDDGLIVRTRVLRGAWHYVAADDLHLLLALDDPEALPALRARRARLGLDERTVANAYDALGSALTGKVATRAELGTILRREGVLGECSMFGQQVGHLLELAEHQGLITSGPTGPDGAGETFALTDERVASHDEVSREQAVQELVERFVASHGPVSEPDLCRWAGLEADEVRPALAGLAGVRRVAVAGVDLWTPVAASIEPAPTLLLPDADEAIAPYRDGTFPRAPGRPPRESGVPGGPVLDGLRDVGAWSIERTADAATLRVTMAPDAARPRREDLLAAAEAWGRLVAPEGASIEVAPGPHAPR